MSASTPLLSVDNLSVSYGPAQVLFGISLRIEPGESLAVLGPNGAGKSTLGRALAGMVVPSAGRLLLDGRDVTGWGPHRLARAGVAYLPEERGIFPGLSVAENLRLFARLAPRADRRPALDGALDLFPVLHSRSAQRAGTLSGGEQQLLALARLTVGAPRLIVADEPGLGLAPMMIETVLAALDRVRGQGAALVIIEQYVDRALAMADHCLLLRRGEAAWAGPSSDAHAHLLEGYFGAAGPE